jgi:hypothetical protein
MEFNNYGRDARERLHLGVNLREEPGSLPLKGGQNSAQGFNPGLGVLMRCALKGHQNAARRVEFISPQKRSRHSRATFRAHSRIADTQG